MTRLIDLMIHFGSLKLFSKQELFIESFLRLLIHITRKINSEQTAG